MLFDQGCRQQQWLSVEGVGIGVLFWVWCIDLGVVVGCV